MGNNLCQDYHDPLEMPSEESVKPTITTQTKGQTRRQTIFNRSRDPNEPDPNFAEVVKQMPPFSEKINERDRQLGEFHPELDFQQSSFEGSSTIQKIYRLPSGVLYKGSWKNGQLNGPGIMYLKDDSLLKGTFLNNQLKGRCRYITPTGNFYEGQTHKGKAHGEGRLSQNSHNYWGAFENNYLQGRGREEGPGYRFMGEFRAGAKSYGKLIWNLDKNIHSVYEGGFFEQLFSGKGKLINEVGQYEGEFKNGKKKGKGVFLYRTGEKFQGYYDQDLKNGPGKMTNTKGFIILEGKWKNDKYVEQ